MKLDSIRKEYIFNELSKKSCSSNPLIQFENWLKEAFACKAHEPNAMSLITVGQEGYPQSRIVLLKHFDESGYTFFTNFNSQKGQEILKNPKVSLFFFWPELERQVRIVGNAEKTNREASVRYFKSRPITSQIAAIVSNQSEEISGREYIENRFFDLQDKLHGKTPECPPHWGGYRVQPMKYEFWQGRESRLHDRIIYEQSDGNWIKKRLAP